MKIDGNNLRADRCPQCGVATPALRKIWESKHDKNGTAHNWYVFSCSSCLQLVFVQEARTYPPGIVACHPEQRSVDGLIPDRAREYLRQAIDSRNAPAGSVMLAASAVDAMLKSKGYSDGSLYNRIKAAATDHLITDDMAEWAHDVRLEANSQRHSDNADPLPGMEDADRVIEFVEMLGHFLFVLPERVKRGRSAAGGS